MIENKLDNLSKILLATQTINFLAATMYTLNMQMKTIPDEKGYHADGINLKDETLEWAVTHLAEVMEVLGNVLNGCDAVTPIDQKITQAAFDIIVRKQDDVEPLEDQDPSLN